MSDVFNGQYRKLRHELLNDAFLLNIFNTFSSVHVMWCASSPSDTQLPSSHMSPTSATAIVGGHSWVESFVNFFIMARRLSGLIGDIILVLLGLSLF